MSGCCAAAGKVREVVYAFVSLDSIALEPHFRNARQAGAVQHDRARRRHVPPRAAGRGVAGAVPADARRPRLRRDAPQPRAAHRPLALRRRRRARRDARAHARRRAHPHAPRRPGRHRPVPRTSIRTSTTSCAWPRSAASCRSSRSSTPTTSCKEGPPQSMRINRLMTDGVVETPHGAHFTECVPDYPRDEAFQKEYAAQREERRGVGRVPGEVHRRDRSRVPAGGVGVSDIADGPPTRAEVCAVALRRLLPRRRRDPRQPDRHAADDRRPARQGDVRARSS